MRIRALAVATAVACVVTPVPALAADGATYYSTKQHYEPQGSEYASAPEGFHQIYTSTVCLLYTSDAADDSTEV